MLTLSQVTKNSSNCKKGPHHPTAKSTKFSAPDIRLAASSSVSRNEAFLLLLPHWKLNPMPSCSSRPPVWAFEELLQLFPLHGKQFSVLEGKVSGALGVSSVTLSLNHFLDIREEKNFLSALLGLVIGILKLNR